MKFKFLSLPTVLLLLISTQVCAVAQGENQADIASSSIQKAVASFLIAFDNLDWPAFRSCFTDDATMFHPAAPNVKRIDTPEAFDKAWLGVFARIKKQSGRNAPPYMNLQPQDLRIQMLSQEIGLVTFHLVDGSTVSRRTILLKRFPNGWKILHIHASNIVVSAPTLSGEEPHP